MKNKKPIVVSKKTKDRAMRIICDFHVSPARGAFIDASSLTKAGLPNAEHVVAVLESEGHIKYHKPDGFPARRIDLTPPGKCYFETARDERINFWRKSIWTPILVSFITALITVHVLPLLLSLLQGLLESKP